MASTESGGRLSRICLQAIQSAQMSLVCICIYPRLMPGIVQGSAIVSRQWSWDIVCKAMKHLVPTSKSRQALGFVTFY